MIDLKISEQEKNKVKEFMYQYHCGYRNAVPRHLIITTLGVDDRRFRAICAEIPEIITSNEIGYYILPLVDMTGVETEIALRILNTECRARFIHLYLRNKKQRNAVRNMRDKVTQREFAFV